MSICTINEVGGLTSSNQRRLARTSDGTLYLAYVTTNASGDTRVYVRSSSSEPRKHRKQGTVTYSLDRPRVSCYPLTMPRVAIGGKNR